MATFQIELDGVVTTHPRQSGYHVTWVTVQKALGIELSKEECEYIGGTSKVPLWKVVLKSQDYLKDEAKLAPAPKPEAEPELYDPGTPVMVQVVATQEVKPYCSANYNKKEPEQPKAIQAKIRRTKTLRNYDLGDAIGLGWASALCSYGVLDFLDAYQHFAAMW